MSLPYFYEPSVILPIHTLSEETSRHCIKVLRMKENDKLHLTDGSGNLFTAIITNADKKNCLVKIEETINHQPQTSSISIAISLLKNPTRLEWFMEKVTEIGVRKIYPLICEHTEKENFRYERMNGILISAMLQSQQTFLPQLHQPKKYIDFIKGDFEGLKLIAHCGEGDKISINQPAFKNKNVLILIGPEGDFSHSEINAALNDNFAAVDLGHTRLRSETAGIVAAALLCS
jgi:16S rRNA (uracil1498-N3)-methyltransferase